MNPQLAPQQDQMLPDVTEREISKDRESYHQQLLSIHVHIPFASETSTVEPGNVTVTVEADETKQQGQSKRINLTNKKNGGGKGPPMAKRKTPILVAAKNGIVEIVEQILEQFPMVINDKSAGKNIVLLAAKSKQPHVLKLLLE
nr:hypothetical protein CFP56_55384 [Quercus suber]